MLYLICIGSNIGNRQENIQKAIDNVIPFVGDVKISKIHETPALLPENADLDWDMPFLNIAISFKSDIAPKDILLILKSIEKKMGRLPAKKWAPRIIDMDILFAGDHIINTPLQIPLQKRKHGREMLGVCGAKGQNHINVREDPSTGAMRQSQPEVEFPNRSNELAAVENFLIIPHAEFLNRDFFIIPAAEIEPDYVHPITKKTLAFHASEIKKSIVK